MHSVKENVLDQLFHFKQRKNKCSLCFSLALFFLLQSQKISGPKILNLLLEMALTWSGMLRLGLHFKKSGISFVSDFYDLDSFLSTFPFEVKQ